MYNKDKNKVIVVLGIDNSYIRPTAVTVYSILESRGKEYTLEFHIVGNRVIKSNKDRIEKIAAVHQNTRIVWYEAHSVVKELPITNDNLSVSGYIPLLIPNILPDKFNKILYLDSDIFVKKDIAKLWNLKCEKYIMAVQDLCIPFVSSKDGIYNYKNLGLYEKHPYFNSGVMIINLKKFRKNGITQELLEYLIVNEENIFHADQEVLNAVLAEKWLPIDPGWNVNQCIRYPRWKSSLHKWPEGKFKEYMENEYDNLLQKPSILHFAGPNKPWIHPYTHPEGYLWFCYLWSSGFFTKGEKLFSILKYYVAAIKFYSSGQLKSLRQHIALRTRLKYAYNSLLGRNND